MLGAHNSATLPLTFSISARSCGDSWVVPLTIATPAEAAARNMPPKAGAVEKSMSTSAPSKADPTSAEMATPALPTPATSPTSRPKLALSW